MARKEVEKFEDLIRMAESNKEISADLSCDTADAIAEFVALVYKEVACGCNVKQVTCNGKDITYMYEFLQVLLTALRNGNEDIKGIIELMLDID